MEYLVAVSSRDGVMVHQHFGHTEEFRIYRVAENESYTYVESRSVQAACKCGEHDEFSMQEVIERIADCKYVLSAKIGPGAQRALQSRGVTPLEFAHLIDYAMEKIMIYDKRKQKSNQS